MQPEQMADAILNARAEARASANHAKA